MGNWCRCRVCKNVGPDICRWQQQSPDTAWKNLFGDAHPACQPALTAAAAAAKSAKILAVLHCAASKGCIGLEKNFLFIFDTAASGGKAWRILGLVYRRLSWLQMQKPDSASKCQNCSTFQTSLNIRTDLAGQLTNISKLISKTRIISMVSMINVHTYIFRCNSIS